MESAFVLHTIPPVYDKNSRVLLLGTMPSPKSREAGFFYGHRQNRMWPVLARIFEEDTPMGAAARRDFLLRHRIAMWDVLSSCAIRGAGDGSIRDPAPNDIRPILQSAPIAAIFCTGKKAFSLLSPGSARAPPLRPP